MERQVCLISKPTFFFFYRNIITLQCCQFLLYNNVNQPCVCVCIYIYIYKTPPSRASLPPSTRSSARTQLSYLATQQASTSRLFYTWQCIYVNPSLPIRPTPFPLTLCLLVRSLRLHFYSYFANRFICTILSRFHINTLIYDTCFSLSDFLHPA